MFAQTVVAFLVIAAGGHLFVSEIEFFSAEVLDVPAALIALLLALFATGLPEKLNSVIWTSERKVTFSVSTITDGRSSSSRTLSKEGIRNPHESWLGACGDISSPVSNSRGWIWHITLSRSTHDSEDVRVCAGAVAVS